MNQSPEKGSTNDKTPRSESHNAISPARHESLEKHLQNRPNAQELVDRHILISTTSAPSIQGKQRELENQILADTLNEKISRRPKPEDLINKGILTETDKLYEERIEEEYAKREGGA